MESAQQLQTVLQDLAAVATEEQIETILDSLESLEQKNQDLEQKLSEEHSINSELMKRTQEQSAQIEKLSRSDLELKNAQEKL